ncbi:MAG: hypothetical protein LBK60_02525 [Verrucomicrobiales bacterium]|jgi:hypothetical protein|nr:hypothetical protein [Verrucomicrobiales bacterium]
MKVLVEIPDRQFSFGMEVLHSLSFVKQARPWSFSATRLQQDLAEACEEVRLHRAGRLKLKSAKAVLDEL